MNLASITPNFQQMQFGMCAPAASSPVRVQEYHDLFRTATQPLPELTSQKQQLYLLASPTGELTSFAAWPRQYTAAQSTPNSYTGDLYTTDDLQQSMVRVPQSAIQSALNHLQCTHELGIAAPIMAPPMPTPDTKMSKMSPNKDDNSSSSASTCESAVPVDTPLFSDSVHGGNAEYRQTLNPALYNSYRTSSPPRNNKKANVVHVIAETVYRVPDDDGRYRKQDRFDKTSLYKTELCTNWMLTGACTYGNKCHFAHGVEDLKARMRVENYKTQPCCDPAREGCRRCMYGRRCNYCHPGEPIRRPHPTPYYDKDYYKALRKSFPENNEFPFGIYV